MSNILTKWKATNYVGEDMSEYYVIATKTRDSSLLLEESNFECIRERLDDLKIDNCYRIDNFVHWVCGGFDQLFVHENAHADVIATCEDIINELGDYPILDEDHYSELQSNAIYEYWENCDDNEKLELSGGETVADDTINDHAYDQLNEMFF